MLYVDDTHFDQRYFQDHFALFDAHPILGRGGDARLAVRTTDNCASACSTCGRR